MSEKLSRELGVSRETLERLNILVEHLLKWNKRINLIGPCRPDEIWLRHILDCAQLDRAAPPSGAWVDVGAGGGLPGLVISAIRQGRPGHRITLVESDQRKCAFLIDTARRMQIDVAVENRRVEDLRQRFDIISARALAPLPKLLEITSHLSHADTVLIFPKGRTAAKEIESARMSWKFSVETLHSLTSEESAILRIRDVTHV